MQQNQYNIVTGWFVCSGSHPKFQSDYCYKKLFYFAGPVEEIHNLCIELKCPKCGTINLLKDKYIRRIN